MSDARRRTVPRQRSGRSVAAVCVPLLLVLSLPGWTTPGKHLPLSWAPRIAEAHPTAPDTAGRSPAPAQEQRPGCWRLSEARDTLHLRVWRGMTVSDLAVHFRTSNAAVREACGLRDDRLRSGQTCRFPLDRLAAVLHLVRSGETLSELRQRFGLPSRFTIRMLNCRDSNRILVGERLLLLVPRTGEEGTR